MSSCTTVIAHISFFSIVHSIIIFNYDKFIIDAPFVNIKNAVTSGHMKCGLENENVEPHHNKYNGTHIIFSYIQHCDRQSMKDYAKKEDIYFNEFMDCSLDYPLRRKWRRTKYYKFSDTCSIQYDEACEDRFLGPCVSSPDNLTTSTISIVIDNKTDEFTTEEIQSRIGDVMTCDPNNILKKQENKTQFDEDYRIFYYGKQMCVKQIRFHSSHNGGHASVGAQARYGNKRGKEQPVTKSEIFHK